MVVLKKKLYSRQNGDISEKRGPDRTLLRPEDIPQDVQFFETTGSLRNKTKKYMQRFGGALYRRCNRSSRLSGRQLRFFQTMVAPSTAVHTTLADVFLSRISDDRQRITTVRSLASNIDEKTLGLVAALADQCPDEEANVHLNDFLIRSIEQGDAASAAELCVQYPRIRDVLLHWTDRELHICFSQLLRQPGNTGFVVPADEVLTVDPFVSHYDPELGVERQLEDLVKSTVLYLSFAKQLFRSPIDDESFVVSSPIVCAMFGLLASSNADIAAAAKDTTLAFLASFKAGTFTFSHYKQDPDELDRHLWRCIQNLLEFSQSSAYKTTAYTIWLRWLDLPSYGHSRQVALQKDPYWKYLLGTLGQSSQGDTEQRKICLHVLKKSISITRNNIWANDMELILDQEDKPGMLLMTPNPTALVLVDMLTTSEAPRSLKRNTVDSVLCTKQSSLAVI